ncbi:hypothetical protein IWZ01DRAFT_106771 [Phyllosticta capitalensis]
MTMGLRGHRVGLRRRPLRCWLLLLRLDEMSACCQTGLCAAQHCCSRTRYHLIRSTAARLFVLVDCLLPRAPTVTTSRVQPMYLCMYATDAHALILNHGNNGMTHEPIPQLSLRLWVVTCFGAEASQPASQPASRACVLAGIAPPSGAPTHYTSLPSTIGWRASVPVWRLQPTTPAPPRPGTHARPQREAPPFTLPLAGSTSLFGRIVAAPSLPFLPPPLLIIIIIISLFRNL